MDASSKTPRSEDGKQGGRCLNDLVMKGKVDTLDLIKMLLRFSVDGVGFSGDLKQFYPSMALDKSQWNLQRVLWKEDMSPDAPVEEWLIVSLTNYKEACCCQGFSNIRSLWKADTYHCNAEIRCQSSYEGNY